MWTMFLPPALRLVGRFLQSLDENDTGIDDSVGKILVQLADSDDLEEFARRAKKKGLVEA